MEDSVSSLAYYRLNSSKEALADAKIMYANKRYKNALNRSYYAIFHAMRAVNILKGFDSSKHSGVIAFFNQNFVKEGIFPKEMSKIIKYASENREKADYMDFFIASKGDAESQIFRAEKFQESIVVYLKDQGVLFGDDH